MERAYIEQIIRRGEGVSIEFKESRTELNKSVFETVCSFLNRNGGHILLGVKDDGSICGIDETYIYRIINTFVTSANNPQKLFPPFYLAPEIIDFDGTKVIYIFVPESSQVHSTVGKTFDRNDEGDFNISANAEHIARIYLRKQTIFSENQIYPFATLNDLRKDLIDRVRRRAKNESAGSHPWFDMDDLDMLKSAQLYRKDLITGKEGITLACILLFGKDYTILSALPHYRTDAILRKDNLDRYDDRDDIRTNLIDSYDRMMAFVAKHLPDPFFIDGTTRISLRNVIFREAITNILIHREFLSAFPAKMIIDKNRVIFENGNRTHGFGAINPQTFTPFPKNPVIARVFKEIGMADELGSGVRNLFKFTGLYSNGNKPQLIEDDIFKIIIPINVELNPDNNEQFERFISDLTANGLPNITAGVRSRLINTLELIFHKPGIKATEIQSIFKMSKRTILDDLSKLSEYIEYRGDKLLGGYFIK